MHSKYYETDHEGPLDYYQCMICGYLISNVEWSQIYYHDVGCPRCDTNMLDSYRRMTPKNDA